MARRVGALTFAGVTLRNLFRHPMRTILTALGVSVGVIAVVTLASIANGFWRMTDQTVRLAHSDLMVFQSNQAADFLSTLDEKKTRDELRAVPGVADTAGSLWTIQRVDDHPFMFVMGVGRDEYAFRTIELREGALPEKPNQVLLGRIAAKTLGARVGSAVRIGVHAFEVSGIFAGSIVIIDAGIILDLSVAQAIASREGQITAALVRLAPGVSREAAVREIESRLPHLSAVSDASEYVKVDRGLMVAQAMVWAVSAVALLIGGLVVLNTMWMSVFERTREIGILRSLGWSKRWVMRMVLTESVLIGAAAAVVGSLFGVGLAELTRLLRFSEQFVAPVYSAAVFARASVVALLIGALGGAIPCWRASRFSPIEALRYE